MCFWHQIDRRKNNENADQYLSLYHGLRLLSATDFDDILVWSVLKLTLHEPNYKKKEVHWRIRLTNSGLRSAFFYRLPLSDLYGSSWNIFVQALGQNGWILADSFFCVFKKKSRKRTRLIFSHLDRTSSIKRVYVLLT